MKNFLTIGVYDAITNIGLWAVRNVPAAAIFADNFEDELFDRFACATGITPNGQPWHIVDAYDEKI